MPCELCSKGPPSGADSGVSPVVPRQVAGFSIFGPQIICLAGVVSVVWVIWLYLSVITMHNGADMTDTLLDLKERLRCFSAERDWAPYHAPKNLAMALIVEAGELVEHFQWLTEQESAALSAQEHVEVAAEMADVLLYLVKLADKLDIDLYAAALNKIERNAEKYPANQVRGRPNKYTEDPTE